MFSGALMFNADISSWNVASVKKMNASMLSSCFVSYIYVHHLDSIKFYRSLILTPIHLSFLSVNVCGCKEL